MKREEQRARRCYRLPPCPAYDVEGTESWLEAMAAQGWQLSETGFFAGLAAFEKAPPQPVRYRLQAAPESTGLLAENGGQPAEESLALGEAYGWEYIANRGQFYIFAAQDPAARELDTDPQVQALALDMVRRREQGSLTSSLLWLAVYPVVYFWGAWLLLAVEVGPTFCLWGAGLCLWALGRSAARVVHLRRLRRRLAQGLPLNHRKDWRRHARLYQAAGVVFLALALCWAGVLLHRWGADLVEENRFPLQTYGEALPFPTLQDLQPGGEFSWEEFGSHSNTVRRHGNWLAPEVVALHQTGRVRLADGRTFQGLLTVDYCETRWPWVARELARELQQQDRRRNRKYYALLPTPDLPVERAAAYTAIFPTLVLQEGNRVVRVSLAQTSGDYTMPLEEWAPIFADAMQP